MASCKRPSDLASPNVSSNCSGLTPATGIIRFIVLTKLESVGGGAGAAGIVSGAGATGSVGGGGNGVPIATGAGGEIGETSTDGITGGTTGGILKLIAPATSEIMARNRTLRRILNFAVPMERFRDNYRSKPRGNKGRTSVPPKNQLAPTRRR